VTGLVNGTSYLFRVAAVNDVGTGAFTPPSAVVVPATLPGEVRDLIYAADTGLVTLLWKAPASDGGSAIIDYLVEWSADDGKTWNKHTRSKPSTLTTTTLFVFGGTFYRLRVAAINGVGTGPTVAILASGV